MPQTIEKCLRTSWLLNCAVYACQIFGFINKVATSHAARTSMDMQQNVFQDDAVHDSETLFGIHSLWS
jgi:hypothetical protein